MSWLARQYPPNHRIDDWENPWLPAPIRLLNAFPEPLIKRLTRLEENHLLTQAKKETGLQDFGDEDFLVPFRILLEDLNTYDHFSNLGRITAKTILHQQLCARLYLEEKLKRSPEIRQQKINSPLIIAGLPRTGTTHLHNLLSQVRRLRYMPLWQTLQPATPHGKGKDHRRRAADMAVFSVHSILPLFPRMHEMQTDDPHEELTVCALCYRSFFFEGAFQVPRYRAWYGENSHEKGYEYLKQTLQILQSTAAPTLGNKTADARWILKSPQHVDQLETILKVFPDAKIILTHRDPAQSVLSMITMMLYASRQVYKPTRLKEEARAWLDRLEQMLRRSQEQAERIPDRSILHIHFDEFMAHPQDIIQQVVDFADVEIDPLSSSALAAYLASHVRDRYGKVEYHFEDIGLHEEEVKERFHFYQKI